MKEHLFKNIYINAVIKVNINGKYQGCSLYLPFQGGEVETPFQTAASKNSVPSSVSCQSTFFPGGTGYQCFSFCLQFSVAEVILGECGCWWRQGAPVFYPVPTVPAYGMEALPWV